MANAVIRVGLLGAGYIADWHAAALNRNTSTQILAICDVSRESAQKLADKLGVKNVFGSLEAMIESGTCDVIHVLTPPNLHYENIRTILEGGIHVFAEKPFSLSVTECEKLTSLAKERGHSLAVNHNFLTLPSYEKLRRDILDGTLGIIDTLTVNWQFPLVPLRSGPYGLWMLRAPENLLLELGPHLFAFVQDLLGSFENAKVRLRNPICIPGNITHFQSWQILGDVGTASVTVNISLVEGHDNRSLEVRGSNGLARVNYADDTYCLEQANASEIVVGPLIASLSVARQAMSGGIRNAVRQFTSLNELSPYGLSISRAVDLFYGTLGKSTDNRLSAESATSVINMVRKSIDAARPQLMETVTPKQCKKPPKPTILVIGGTGFIGRHLSNGLADQGYAVRVLSRGRAVGFEREDGRISSFTGSLKIKEDILSAMEGIETVFHLARAEEETWEGYLENDIETTKNIGVCCLKAGIKKLIYTGTIDSYNASRKNRPITEETSFDHNLAERNLYARSKAQCEFELQKLHIDKGLPLVIARPGIVVGSGGPLQHWGIAKWQGAGACKLWGRGENIIPFVLVDDVVRAMIKMIEREYLEGKSFNLIGEPLLTANGYFEAIHSLKNVKIRVQPTPVIKFYIIDILKYFGKKYLARKKNLKFPCLRDWKSRSQVSPYINKKAKEVLDWQPESDQEVFARKAIVDSNLFGF